MAFDWDRVSLIFGGRADPAKELVVELTSPTGRAIEDALSIEDRSMPRPHITVVGLLGIVLAAGVGLAALITGTRIWHQAIYTLAVLILFLAAIASRYRRPFWFGFAIVGWAICSSGWAPGSAPSTGHRS